MGNEVGAFVGAVGFTLIVGVLLGMSGVAGSSIIIPENPGAGDKVEQSFGEAVVECVFTFFTDCDQSSEMGFWTAITNFIGFIFSFLGFFFQLLTFQLPLPVWVNALIISPLAVTMVYLGMRFFRGGG